MPFALTLAQKLVMETSVGDGGHHRSLLIKGLLDQQQQTCGAAGEADMQLLPPPPPAPETTDRLLRADGAEISTLSLEDVLREPVGSVVVLPLFTPAATDSQTSVLSGFARVEIFRPTTLEFEPTSETRKSEVQKWKALVAAWKQEQLERELAAALNTAAREQEEKDRRAAEENAKLEHEAKERLEREEHERLSLTPHEHVGEKRAKGLEFRYEVEFARAGPIGINWDLHTTGKTVVSYLEPRLRAFTLGVIAPNDQLIQLNDVNTTDMEPYEVVAEYAKTTLPRTLVFLCASTKPRAETEATELQATFIQNWTLAFVKPQVLTGWHVRLHVANWSAMPEVDDSGQSSELTLVQANPLLACHPLSAASKSSTTPTMRSVMYVSYRGGCTFMDKAEHARQADGKAVLVLNNIKGEGRFPPGMPTTGSVPLPVTMYERPLLPVLSRPPLTLILRVACVCQDLEVGRGDSVVCHGARDSRWRPEL